MAVAAGTDGTYVHYEEYIDDDFYAIINGYKPSYRLTIFKLYPGLPSAILYQADADKNKGLKKLKDRVGDFRYGFIKTEYDSF